MEHVFYGKPDFSCVKINLSRGEQVIAESGAMVSMSSGIEIETGARGGLLASAKRTLLAGESLFINTFTCREERGEIIFAPPQTGEMEHRRLEGGHGIPSRGAFICGSPESEIDSTWGGCKALFGGEGLFFLKAAGRGDLFFSSFGALHRVEVDGEYIVDTGHIAAFDPGLDFKISKVGGLKSLFLSGEGLVCRFSGKGVLYLQSRNQSSFAAWANQFRRIEKKQ